LTFLDFGNLFGALFPRYFGAVLAAECRGYLAKAFSTKAGYAKSAESKLKV
jgi:hypothetical protein